MVKTNDYIPVVCGIIEQNDTFLAAKRGGNRTNAGLWEFPGGKVDDGELPSEALARELFEELNVEVKTGRKLQSVFYEYPWIKIELIPFICEITDGTATAYEHEEIRFIRIDDTASLEWSPADRTVLECYRALKNTHLIENSFSDLPGITT